MAGLGPDREAGIRKDLAALAKDIKRMIPQPGAMMALSFLTDRGIEAYTYNWGQQIALDGSKPLDILQHVRNVKPLPRPLASQANTRRGSVAPRCRRRHD